MRAPLRRDNIDDIESGLFGAVLVIVLSVLVALSFLHYRAPEEPMMNTPKMPANWVPDAPQGAEGQSPTSDLAGAPGGVQEASMSATIVSITAYLTDVDLSENNASAGVYDATGNLLGVTIEKGIGEMTGGGEWVEFTFASPLDVSAYEQVRLAIFGDHEEIGRTAGGDHVYYDTGGIYYGVGAWPPTIADEGELPPSWTSVAYTFSIYATGGNGAKIGIEAPSGVGYYGAGQQVTATGLLATAPLDTTSPAGAGGPLFTGGGML